MRFTSHPLVALTWVTDPSEHKYGTSETQCLKDSFEFPVQEFSTHSFVLIFSCKSQEGLVLHQQMTGQSGESGKKDDVSLILHTWCFPPLRSYLRVVTDNFSAWFKANSCWFDCLATEKWRMTLKMDNHHKSPHSNVPRKKLKNNGFRDICCTP